MKPLPSDDDAIVEWVTRRLRALDTAPRDRAWKSKALGMPRPVALAQVPREYRIDFRVPVAEMRILNDIAASRDTGARAYVRRCVATMLVAAEGVDIDMIPGLSSGGLIGPR